LYERNRELKDFSRALPRELLDIEDKTRSNIFAWRGQFSPQLIQHLLTAYCPDGAVVLDPFAGSGTVLHEAALLHFEAHAFEVNPAAWIFSKIYEFANIRKGDRQRPIVELRKQLEKYFPIVLFSDKELSLEDVQGRVIDMGRTLSDQTKILFNTLVILLDLVNNPVTSDFIHGKFAGLARLVDGLPYSDKLIKADLQDARAIPLGDGAVGFVITSPPYINVFNYHQNYRRSVEVLGWDLLRVAKSEIGSNRANRGNRFSTVVQYCLDIAAVLQEISRVLHRRGRAVFVVGHESKVLGVPFYNADIIQQIATTSGLFEVALRQKRVFTNRFGEAIREDILNLVKSSDEVTRNPTLHVARSVAQSALETGLEIVSANNGRFLSEVLARIHDIHGTPVFNSLSYRDYQTRDLVMMVKEDEERI
jgi:hypothetical protein